MFKNKSGYNQVEAMKRFSAVILSILLLTFGVTMNVEESFADTPMQEKEDIIEDLKEIKNDSDTKKKTKKIIDAAIKKMDKTLDEKFWKDESSLNLKPGKKVLNNDQNAVKKLEKILKDKKESDDIKEEINEINLRIAEVDKILVENAIASVEDLVMSDKGTKKLNKAIAKFEKGCEELEDGDYDKAIKNFKKAWDLLKKAIKDPHFKKFVVESEHAAFLDNTFDNIPDAYLKISKSTKENKPKLVEIKITNDCVNGITHDDAAMKIGISTPRTGPGAAMSTEFFDEEVHATNKWFKQNDPDKRIDPAVITTISEYFTFPVTGDDLIQKNAEDVTGSFEYSPEPIPEIGDQSGWTGKFKIDVEPGEYELHFWMPLTSPSNQGDSCNFISTFHVEQTFE